VSWPILSLACSVFADSFTFLANRFHFSVHLACAFADFALSLSEPMFFSQFSRYRSLLMIIAL